jgi:uncharacterized protein YbjT (DUF2867 family)
MRVRLLTMSALAGWPLTGRMTFLITGGTGKSGSRVAQRLTARGLPVRIGSRKGQPPFEWHDPSTWQPVLRDVSAAYLAYVPDLTFPGAAEAIRGFADAAVEAGVRRLVLLSGRGEDRTDASERAVTDSGAEWTVLRSALFAQDFSEDLLLPYVEVGAITLPAADVGEPFVDLADVADVAVEALTGDGHAGRVYELTGPRLVTFAEAAAEISAVSGRDLRYEPVTPEESTRLLTEAGMPPSDAAALTDLFATVLDGRNAYVTKDVPEVLDRPARDFSDYVRAAAAAGAWR